MRPLILTILMATTPFLANAQGYRAENQLVVVPLSAKSFEVIEARGEGPRGIWCAAASYAQTRLGAPRSSRIYIKKGRGASQSVSGKKAVVFTTNAKALGAKPTQAFSLSVRKVGLGLPVHHARQFCIDYTLDIFDTNP